MTPAPFSKVLAMVAAIKGKALPADRQELADLVNGARQLLWRNEAFRLSYFKERGCAQTNGFGDYCRNCSWTPRNFVGMVLPPNVMNPTELTADFCSFNITTEQVIQRCWPWYQWRTMRPNGDERPRAERLPPRLLERDIPACGDSRRVFFRSDSACDCGSLVGVRYTDLTGREMREDLVLSTAPVGTSLSVSEFLEITLPERQGWITVDTEDGQFLGRYHPSVYVPLHEWYKLEIWCPGIRIQWRAQKEPVPLVFDTDMVEFSDRPMWELAVQVLEMQSLSTLSPNEQQNLARIYEALGQVSNADMDAKKKSFNIAVTSGMSVAVSATARAFAGPAGRRLGWARY